MTNNFSTWSSSIVSTIFFSINVLTLKKWQCRYTSTWVFLYWPQAPGHKNGQNQTFQWRWWCCRSGQVRHFCDRPSLGHLAPPSGNNSRGEKSIQHFPHEWVCAGGLGFSGSKRRTIFAYSSHLFAVICSLSSQGPTQRKHWWNVMIFQSKCPFLINCKDPLHVLLTGAWTQRSEYFLTLEHCLWHT